MARTIVVTSGKGGVGKTTVCANLGAQIATLGFRVVLLDVDIGLNNLDVVMGIEKRVMFDLVDVAEGKCRPRQALVQDKRIPSLYVLPSAHSDNKNVVTGKAIKTIIDEMKQQFDYVFIDCPAGVENGFHRAVYPASEALVVATPHLSSIRDADKVISILSSYPLEKKSLIVNRMRGDLVVRNEEMDEDDISTLLKTPLLGVVPEDDEISALLSRGALAISTSAGKAFSILAENLHSGTKKIYDYSNRYRGLLGSLRSTLRKHC